MQYVEGGGTLLINAKQVEGSPLSEHFLGCAMTKERGEGKTSFGILDSTVISETKNFGFRRLNPTTAVPLVFLADSVGEETPLVLANSYGRGTVIVTAPDYLYESGSENRMLKLFSYLMQHLADELVPVRVEGNVERIICRNSTGWVVTLINNGGLSRQGGMPMVFDEKKRVEATVTLLTEAGGEKVSAAREWMEAQAVPLQKGKDGVMAKVIVPPGDVRILEFQMN
jgi:hypothetical protein